MVDRWWHRIGGLLALGTCLAGCGAPITSRQAREATSTVVSTPEPDWAAESSEDVVVLARAAAGLPDERRAVVEVALAMTGARSRQEDCSRFAQRVFALSRTFIPRTTRQQFSQGRPVDTRDLVAGDLVFFSFSQRPVDHVGIYTGRGSFVHVSSSTRTVRLESLSKAVFANSVVSGCSFLDR